MRHGLRRLDPISFKKALDTNRPGPPPQMLMLAPHQLVVNEEYQRGLSETSMRRIRKMASNFDWAKFKTISVAPCGEEVTEDVGEQLYSVIDGQHTALAAATNGNVELLPCLLHPHGTLASEATGFVAINKERITLTQIAIYNAELAAGDDKAIAISCALSYSKCKLIEVARADGRYQQGETMALGSMRIIYKSSGEQHLTNVLKAVDIAMSSEGHPEDLIWRIGTYLKDQGPDRVEIIAKSETARGNSGYETMANKLISALGLVRKRRGK